MYYFETSNINVKHFLENFFRHAVCNLVVRMTNLADRKDFVVTKYVLIADDEEDLTWSISRSLRRDRKDIQVICVNSGDEAMRVMEKQPIDLLVTDLRMPGYTGLELMDSIVRNQKPTKVIVMTAYGNPETEGRVKDRGGLHYIEKPFEIRELKQLIYNVLSERNNASGLTRTPIGRRIYELSQIQQSRDTYFMLDVVNDKKKGQVYFWGNTIVHARCGRLKGERALREISSWPSGVFKVHSNVRPPEYSLFPVAKEKTPVGDAKSITSDHILKN